MNCALGNYIDDALLLRLENPTQYYLNHIDDEKIMHELLEDDPYLYMHILRLNFINQMSNHDPIYRCPECRSNIVTDESGEEYCESCGLITRTSYDYVAGQKVSLPYGRK